MVTDIDTTNANGHSKGAEKEKHKKSPSAPSANEPSKNESEIQQPLFQSNLGGTPDVDFPEPTKKIIETADPFADISKLRMSQEYADNLGVEKLLTKITVGKPDKQAYFQIHSSPEYRLDTATLVLKHKKETYLVGRHLWTELAPEITRAMLFTGMTRQNMPFIWPIQLPGPDGKHHEAHQVQLNTAMLAMNRWMRLTWNDQTRGYDVLRASADLKPPKWPDKPFHELLKIAFRDRFINSLDHAALKELRGEA